MKPEPAATTADGAHFQDGVCELTGHTGGVLTCLFSPASTPVPNVLATGYRRLSCLREIWLFGF